MCNTFKKIIFGKNWYKNLLKKIKSWYKYAKDTYFLTNRLKLELNELPSQNSRSTYPSSSKENEVIYAEIVKLIQKKHVHSTP